MKSDTLRTRRNRVYYQKVPTEDGSYTMDHTAVIYWSRGKLVTVIPDQEDDASAVGKLKNLAALPPTS
jgi:cytochrome oxidase Cu insertion factor (SCO1/SenC/PrrC family)